MRLPDSSFLDERELQDIINKASHSVDYHKGEIKDHVIMYEVSRILGDKLNIDYHRNMILGKLGLVY